MKATWNGDTLSNVLLHKINALVEQQKDVVDQKKMLRAKEVEKCKNLTWWQRLWNVGQEERETTYWSWTGARSRLYDLLTLESRLNTAIANQASSITLSDKEIALISRGHIVVDI